MVETIYPWDFSQVPNYESAPGVAVEDASQLSSDTFRRRYELHNRPCLIKRAVEHWPASRLWADSNYIASKIGDFEIQASCRPRVEGFGLRPKSQDAIANARTRNELLQAEKVRDLLPRLRTPDDDVLFIELRPAAPVLRCLGDDLAVNGARFPFLPIKPRPRFGYSGWAAMFYKNSYSDWHFHPGTEAIMCQVLGTKDVLLLPPTQESWSQIVPIHAEQWKVYDVDLGRAPAYREIRPYHVVVEPGDGLYLPVNWWHAVQGRRREHGVTVPITWDSSFHDLRQPATRHFLRVLWNGKKSFASKMFLSAVSSTGANIVRSATTGRRSHDGM